MSEMLVLLISGLRKMELFIPFKCFKSVTLVKADVSGCLAVLVHVGDQDLLHKENKKKGHPVGIWCGGCRVFLWVSVVSLRFQLNMFTVHIKSVTCCHFGHFKHHSCGKIARFHSRNPKQK